MEPVEGMSVRDAPAALVRAIASAARPWRLWLSARSEPMTLAGALVCTTDGRILLLHRNTPTMSWWEVPGGKIEPGETQWEAASRELVEELNAVVEPVVEIGTGEFDSDGRRLRYTWFLARVVDGIPAVVETDRFDKLSYFTVEEAATIEDPSPSLRRLLELHGEDLRALAFGTELTGSRALPVLGPPHPAMS